MRIMMHSRYVEWERAERTPVSSPIIPRSYRALQASSFKWLKLATFALLRIWSGLLTSKTRYKQTVYR